MSLIINYDILNFNHGNKKITLHFRIRFHDRELFIYLLYFYAIILTSSSKVSVCCKMNKASTSAKRVEILINSYVYVFVVYGRMFVINVKMYFVSRNKTFFYLLEKTSEYFLSSIKTK